jgi:hypothetical protein
MLSNCCFNLINEVSPRRGIMTLVKCPCEVKRGKIIAAKGISHQNSSLAEGKFHV